VGDDFEPIGVYDIFDLDNDDNGPLGLSSFSMKSLDSSSTKYGTGEHGYTDCDTHFHVCPIRGRAPTSSFKQT
jgi:hypothetical protein